MKKMIALILTALLLCTAALAEVVTIEGTGFKLDIGSMGQEELTSQDRFEEIVLACFNEDDTMELLVYAYGAGGYTLADMEEEMEEEDGKLSSGYTTINGIETYFWVGTDEEGGYFVEYFALDADTDMFAQFIFWYADETAAQETGVVMGTLTK